jgi:predicted transcriptional regulator
MKQKGSRIVVSIGLPRDAAVRLEALAERQERAVSWLAARFVVRGLD